MKNFELNPDNKLHQKKLRSYVEKDLQGKFGRFHLDDYNRSFLRSILTEELPEMFNGRRIILVDCRSIDDPDRYPHVGTYPEIFEKVMNHPKLNRYAHPITIVLICTS